MSKLKSRQIDSVGARWSEEVTGIISLQLYSRQYCRSLLAYAKDANWWGKANIGVENSDGSYGSVTEADYRSASCLTPQPESRLSRGFASKIHRIIKPLANQLWRIDLRKHTSFQIVRYAPGDFYLAHTDNMIEANYYRYFTVLCYLNDDFEGGNTSFPTITHSVVPRAGKTIIFPSSYLHCAEPILSGQKYVLVTWLTGAPPIDWV